MGLEKSSGKKGRMKKMSKAKVQNPNKTRAISNLKYQ
jgi:hypothetical protein